MQSSRAQTSGLASSTGAPFRAEPEFPLGSHPLATYATRNRARREQARWHMHEASPPTWRRCAISAAMVGVPALTGRCQDGAELALWLACGCSLVLTMRVAVDKAIGSAV